jgi:hypothetical protein
MLFIGYSAVPLVLFFMAVCSARAQNAGGAFNGSNGWAHNLEAREFANDTAVCGLRHGCREQRLTLRPAESAFTGLR